jgi:hypothetical protein
MTGAAVGTLGVAAAPAMALWLRRRWRWRPKPPPVNEGRAEYRSSCGRSPTNDPLRTLRAAGDRGAVAGSETMRHAHHGPT